MFQLIMCENFDEWMIFVYVLVFFILVCGEGLCLWDQQGKEYIDFVGGIVVNVLGYVYLELCEVLNEQVSKFWYIGNGYINELVL